MFVTRETSICSAAPALALSTTAVSPAARRLGMMTPWTPAHSAVRKIAPRLCGSAISSHDDERILAPLGGTLQNILDGGVLAHCRLRDDALVRTRGAERIELAPVALGDDDAVFPRLGENARKGAVGVAAGNEILSIVRPARIASATALRPSIRSSLS